jgi:hypothetical protein
MCCPFTLFAPRSCIPGQVSHYVGVVASEGYILC